MFGIGKEASRKIGCLDSFVQSDRLDILTNLEREDNQENGFDEPQKY